ncbi:MAG: hypothetical protein WA949_13330 [Phormidesmis sp.]
MTERLDRIEAAIARTSSNVDDLLGAIAITDRQVRDLRGESADAQQRFEVLRAEAQNDREEYRALFNDAIAEMRRQQTDWQARFDKQQATIERLLLSLLNRADTQDQLQARVANLGDRLDGLERAS